MKFDIHIHIHPSGENEVTAALDKLRRQIATLERTTMATNAQTVDTLKALTTQVGKVSDEVKKLIDAIGNSGNTDPTVLEAIDALRVALQGLDDLNPDAA